MKVAKCSLLLLTVFVSGCHYWHFNHNINSISLANIAVPSKTSASSKFISTYYKSSEELSPLKISLFNYFPKEAEIPESDSVGFILYNDSDHEVRAFLSSNTLVLNNDTIVASCKAQCVAAAPKFFPKTS